MEWDTVKTKLAIHVVPHEDSRLHEVIAPCWCRPRMDDERLGIVIHHSMLPDDENPEKIAH